MQVFKINRNSLPQVNNQHLNLVYNQEAYLPFINHTLSLENYERQIDEKELNFPKDNRKTLVDSLLSQYKNVKNSEGSLDNIRLLADEKTFTITTGHQLSFFTGPLYFVAKILHVIKLCKNLKETYPEYNFVPVYWMASEDHDFEEIQSMKLFSKDFTWESDQKGPVGRFNLDGLNEIKESIREMFSNPDGEIHELLNAYDGVNYTDATRNLVHHMFHDYNLIIIDGDDKRLKTQFSPIVRKELVEQFSFPVVVKTNDKLIKEGAKIQVNPREINLFYIKDGVRTRIVKENELYSIDGIGEFTQGEILAVLEQNPECFSPNVILRPLYQETILPNLAYIGGVGEISYWLQIKGVFDAVDCTYPLIGVRNSVMWIDPVTARKKAKIDLLLEDVFKTKDQLKKDYVQNNAEDSLDFTALEKAIAKLQKEVSNTVLDVDSSMEGYASAEISRLSKQMDALKAKLIKISKSKHTVAMQSIDQIIDKLFPDGKLQERVTNFFSFCPDGNYSKRLYNLYLNIDPEEKHLIIVKEI